MKVHITYTARQQVSEDSWQPYTEIIDIDETDTIYEIDDSIEDMEGK